MHVSISKLSLLIDAFVLVLTAMLGYDRCHQKQAWNQHKWGQVKVKLLVCAGHF